MKQVWIWGSILNIKDWCHQEDSWQILEELMEMFDSCFKHLHFTFSLFKFFWFVISTLIASLAMFRSSMNWSSFIWFSGNNNVFSLFTYLILTLSQEYPTSLWLRCLCPFKLIITWYSHTSIIEIYCLLFGGKGIVKYPLW